ncbi:hypothetical protein scyTo_0001984 [Scyliorhinus torazame]|uniref:Uncharacterized protein n=1 Tax=Scyliorhinus torazame TaxID=75743 RepID=A0A401PH09_SCYTO|nr:hypothetical protein [Scyliorhinus torazame]
MAEARLPASICSSVPGLDGAGLGIQPSRCQSIKGRADFPPRAIRYASRASARCCCMLDCVRTATISTNSYLMIHAGFTNS